MENEGDNQHSLPHTSIRTREAHHEEVVDRLVSMNLFLRATEALDRLQNEEIAEMLEQID
jgi:hypothetical protein